MHINWKANHENPYLFKQQAKWNGVRVHRARVLPGRMLEHAGACHEININLGGHLTTEKISASGKIVRTKGATGNLCITPAGQSIGAFWDKTLDHMGISFDPDFVVRTALRRIFNSNFDVTFAEKLLDGKSQTGKRARRAFRLQIAPRRRIHRRESGS
jgi:hypothetical protein